MPDFSSFTIGEPLLSDGPAYNKINPFDLRFLLRADVGPGELDPARPHVAAAEAAVVNADHLQVAPRHAVALLALEGRIFCAGLEAHIFYLRGLLAT